MYLHLTISLPHFLSSWGLSGILAVTLFLIFSHLENEDLTGAGGSLFAVSVVLFVLGPISLFALVNTILMGIWRRI